MKDYKELKKYNMEYNKENNCEKKCLKSYDCNNCSNSKCVKCSIKNRY